MITTGQATGKGYRVITISRQMGSLGREVGRLIAEKLGYRLVWRDVINQAAQRAGAPEAALATIDELGLLGISPSPQAYQAYRRAVGQVIEELALEGRTVIIGRAGQAILAGRLDVLHVRVIAPPDLRTERVAELQGIALESAKAQVEASDRYRRRYLKRFYHLNWDDPDLYDLVLNTGRLSPSLAAALVCRAVSQQEAGLEQARTPAEEQAGLDR